MVCVDETGPESAKSFAGAHLVDVTTRPAKRGKQEIDYGRRGKGYVFGAFQPESGKALTCTAARRTTANFVAFLERVETWIDPLVERVYGNYEVVALDRLADRYDMDVSRVKRRLVNLTRYVHGKVYFPVRSNSLKEIGRFLGVTWNTATPSGLQSLVWRHLWDVNRTDTFREQLIAYNAADCRALYVLANGLSQIEHTPKAGTRLRVADQPELSLAAPNQPLLEEFKGMLQVAYFDYDHKKLAFRQRVAPTSGKRKRGGMKGHVGHRFKANARLSRANRVVHVAPRATCPNHKGEPLTVSYATAETRLIDLADTKSGWRKVIIRYVGHQAYCRKCEYRYVPPQIAEYVPRLFGQRFQAWMVYLRLELRLPYGAIVDLVEEQFGESISKGSIVTFLHNCSADHAETERAILSHMRTSPAIHVDETRTNVQGAEHYAWVFTDQTHVIFRWRKTRDVSIVEEVLGDFSGVLVQTFLQDMTDCLIGNRSVSCISFAT